MHLKVSDFGLCKTLSRDDDNGVPIIKSSSGHCWQVASRNLTEMNRDASCSTRVSCITRQSHAHSSQAPELLRGDKKYDHTVDIYSMGMILWFVITGLHSQDPKRMHR